MRSKWSKIIFAFLCSAIIFGADFNRANFPSVTAARAAVNLNGRILLQVQSLGEAWYVNPVNSQRYYLGRPDDAWGLMRRLGLGVSNADLNLFLKGAIPPRLAGRILLQVQDKGQAYYINPVDFKLYYLGRPADAFNLMRSKGLGITNADLARIVIADLSPATSSETKLANFKFKYQNIPYAINQTLSGVIYQSYQSSPKIYTYYGEIEPTNLRDAFYGLFLKTKSGDTALDDLIAQLQIVAKNNNWTADQLVEFTLALVQYIPYDQAKLTINSNRNTNPYYPYETLYLDRGVCSDKTFLAVTLLRRLGYGAAILDFPDLNHSAVGVTCPLADSLNGSGYCYAETTNYFPLGVIPQSINSGQAQNSVNEFKNMFNSAVLGKIEIYQKTTGKVYTGIAVTKAKISSLQAAKDELAVLQKDLNGLEAALKTQETALNNLQAQMQSYRDNGQTQQYNDLVPTYNQAVNSYNAALTNYQTKVADFNQRTANFNQAVKDFYQI